MFRFAEASAATILAIVVTFISTEFQPTTWTKSFSNASIVTIGVKLIMQKHHFFLNHQQNPILLRITPLMLLREGAHGWAILGNGEITPFSQDRKDTFAIIVRASWLKKDLCADMVPNRFRTVIGRAAVQKTFGVNAQVIVDALFCSAPIVHLAGIKIIS
jgi:hypothetical protein